MGILRRGGLAHRTRTNLDQVLALCLLNHRLQLGRRKRVDETGLGDDEQKHLRASEDTKLIRLRG